MDYDRLSTATIDAQRLPRERSASAKSRREGDPLYEIVARTLQQEIASGVHPVGALLPTEAELGQRFSVSRHTVREALRKLRNDKLVSSRQGAGTVVEPPRHSEQFVLKAETINDLVSYSTDIWLDLDHAGIETVTGERAVRAGVGHGEQWLAARGYVRGNKSRRPVCWAEHFIHFDFRDVAALLPGHRGPVFRLIEKAMNLEIVEIEQEIRGELMPADQAAQLGVEPLSAAIEVKRTFATTTGKIAQITLHTHPASRFRYSTVMHRPRG